MTICICIILRAFAGVLACRAYSGAVLQSGDQNQNHIPGMPYGSPAYPAYWQQPPAQGLMRAAPPNVANPAYVPQHLSQRSQSQPHLSLPPGRYGGYPRPQQQPPAFGLHLQPQQEQQALEAQAQAQLHQALENQARQAADQQLQPQQQQAAGQAPQPGEALRDRVLSQTSAGGAFRPARWPAASPNDQLNAAQQASDQHRRLAELLASNHLQHNEPSLLRQLSGHQQQPAMPSQQLRNQPVSPIGQLGRSECPRADVSTEQPWWQ